MAQESTSLDNKSKAAIIESLGLVYLNESKYPEAEVFFKEALPIVEESPGPDGQYLAGDLANLAYVIAQMHRYSDAEPLYRRSVRILERMELSSTPAAYAKVFTGYADLLRKMKKPGAEELEARADAILHRPNPSPAR